MGLKINFGCGKTPIRGWVNLDNSFSLFLSKFPKLVIFLEIFQLLNKPQKEAIYFYKSSNIRFANAEKKLSFKSNTADIIYSSHMLEHLSKIKAVEFIKECFRVLKKDGILRIVVPDLKKNINEYLVDQDADQFLKNSMILSPPLLTLKDKLFILFFGYRHHQYMYDSKSIIKLISSVGFRKVCEQPPGRSLILLDDEINFYERKDESIYIEAVK